MNEVEAGHPTREQLKAFGLGRLGTIEREAIERHIAGCDSCSAALGDVSSDSLLAPAKAAGAGAAGPAIPAALAAHPRYRVVGMLGAGGMGVVYRAEHRLMRRLVALKVIRFEWQSDPGAVERFEREFRAAARLVHPNIVAAYDAERAGDLHFLVMEFVEGVTLDRLVAERGPLPVAQACALARQTALGLQHAHEKGLIHRDIKPNNLILSGKTLKILDFGLARVTRGVAGPDGRAETSLTPLTSPQLILGTPDYLAPEQARDPTAADIRSDLYSLGCTLHFLLTGRPPFPGGTPIDKILRHETQPPPALESSRPDAPPALAGVLARLLAKNPADRYATPGEAADALAPFTQLQETVSLAPEGRPRSPSADAPRRGPVRPRVAWVVALAAAVAVLVTALVLSRIDWRTKRDIPGPDVPPAPPLARVWLSQDPLKTHQGEVFDVAFSPDGKMLAAACENLDKKTEAGWVKVYEWPSRRELRSWPEPTGVRRVAFVGDGSLLASATGAEFGSVPGRLTVRVVTTGEQKLNVEAHPGSVLGLAVSPKRDLIATGGRDHRAKVWRVADGECLFTSADLKHEASCVAFSSDGISLAAGCADGTVHVWDLREKKPPKTLSVPNGGSVSGVAFVNEDRTLVASTGVPPGGAALLLRWDLAAKTPESVAPLPDKFDISNVFCLTLAPDGRTLLTGSQGPNGGPVHLWDLERREHVGVLRADSSVRSVAVAPDGSTIAAATGHMLNLWTPSRP